MLASMDPLRIFLMFSLVATLLLMLIAERIWPARQFPFYRGWIWIGIGVIVFFVALANTWSLVVPKEWLREHRLFDGEPLGVAGGITVWYVFNTFVTYWYHRFQHRFSVPWRMLHQVHHGVPRVDIPSALMAHPFDVIVSTTLSILVTAFLLGLDPRAVAIASVCQFFITLFPHWNVRTPNWVGYFIQRPEEHILHHQREVHAGNYSDWPLWDKVFGTYRAPAEKPVQVGFERAGFAEHLKMLAFIDVNVAGYVNRGVSKVHPERAACPPEMASPNK
jgi:sterol desaturase/sphingolipid hydroxylase (fatty acid hydroxylase superfamily)